MKEKTIKLSELTTERVNDVVFNRSDRTITLKYEERIELPEWVKIYESPYINSTGIYFNDKVLYASIRNKDWMVSNTALWSEVKAYMTPIKREDLKVGDLAVGLTAGDKIPSIEDVCVILDEPKVVYVEYNSDKLMGVAENYWDCVELNWYKIITE